MLWVAEQPVLHEEDFDEQEAGWAQELELEFWLQTPLVHLYSYTSRW
jgi:hypothetical protein